MANTLKFGNGQWATKVGSTLAYNDEGGNFKPLPFNFTRSTGATRVNKDGLIEVVTNNKPRIDFLNDSNGALLLEPTRSNSLPYSNDFNNAAWQKIGSSTITANTLISPDGTLNASTFKASSNSYGCILRQLYYGFNYVSPYASSFYVKKKNHRYIGLRLGNLIGPSDTYNFFDFDTETVNNTIAPSAPLSFTKLTNGWYKLSVVGTPISGEVVDLALTQSNGSTINPAGTEEVYVYGAQLEQGSYATSYIPTQGGAVTRNADVISKTGVSDLINGESGTLFLNSASLANDGTIKYFSINNGTTGYEIVFQYTSTSNTVGIRYINGGFAQCDDSVLITNALDFNKFAFTWQLNKFELWCNGIKVISDTSGSVTTGFNQIDFRRSNGTIPFFSKVKSVALYNTALTDQELINLTTI